MILRSLFALVLLAILLVAQNTASAQTVSVMSYNLRLDIASDGENAWPNRREAVANQIAWNAPDILGVQEALPQQVSYLRQNLKGYDYVGIGRQAEKGDEASAIYYNRKRFDVLSSNTFWLSETPNTVSLGWGVSYHRICTYVKLLDCESGKEIFAFNAHLDHQVQEAREKGLALIAQTIDSLVPQGMPVVLMGDFNTTPENAAITQLKGQFTDTFTAVQGPKIGPTATFSGFVPECSEQSRPAGDGDASKPFDRRIDYIFFRGGQNAVVKKYATLTSTQNGNYLSDHLPVMATLEFSRRPIVIGHRGARGHATENSLPSIQVAISFGVEMIEIDVFTVADGEVMVFHDKTLDRLTNATGDIEERTSAELAELTLDGAHRIPTLRDVLTFMDARTRLNVELKGGNTAEPTYRILEEFVNEGNWKWEDFAISSFRHDELRRMRELSKEIEIGILPHGNAQKAIPVAHEVAATSINPFHGKLSQEDVDAVHAAGFKLYPYTVNEPADIRRMTEIGVDGLITDYPDRME